jgi:hypothetical protein
VDALFTPVQQRVLGLLFGQPERRFQSAELIRLAGAGTGAVHRLLTRLAATGLLSVASVGNQKFSRWRYMPCAAWVTVAISVIWRNTRGIWSATSACLPTRLPPPNDCAMP